MEGRTFTTMAITNAQRQRVRSLQQRKWRRKYNAFVVEGLVNVNEVLTSPLTVEELYYTPDCRAGLRGLESLNAGQFYAVTDRELARLSGQQSPHGALAVVTTPSYAPADVLGAARALYLDGVSDPGNVGTLVRTAEWFGVGGILAGPNTADWYNPKVVAAARGSLFRVPHARMPDEQVASLVADRALVVADLDGTRADRFAWPERAVLVIGSESHGPTETIRGLLAEGDAAHSRITIQRRGGALTESLNAGVAGGILLAYWAQA